MKRKSCDAGFGFCVLPTDVPQHVLCGRSSFFRVNKVAGLDGVACQRGGAVSAAALAVDGAVSA